MAGFNKYIRYGAEGEKAMNKTETHLKIVPTRKQFEEWERKFYENLPDDSVKKGPYIKALCRKLRELIPDGECIELDMGDAGITEVDGVDIGVHLLYLLKDISDTAPVIDPRPCEGDPEYNEETADTDLSSIGLEYPL